MTVRQTTSANTAYSWRDVDLAPRSCDRSQAFARGSCLGNRTLRLMSVSTTRELASDTPQLRLFEGSRQMTGTSTAHANLTVSGRPATSPLKDVRALARTMVGHFVDTIFTCRTLPGDAVRGDITKVTRACLELAISMIDGEDSPDKIAKVEDAATNWAREGIPIDTIQHALHEGFKLGFDLIIDRATPEDFDSLKGVSRKLLEVLDTINVTASLAYVKELRAVVGEHHTAVHTLTSALLAGHPTSVMARESGIEVADTYHVVALAVPAHPDELNPALDSAIAARRKLRRVQAAVADGCGGTALSLLSVKGGTLLIPTSSIADGGLGEFIAVLARNAQVPVRATVVDSPATDVPAAAERAHEVLDIVQRLQCQPGLYHFDDLALEYQLTRPGPARETLGSLLDPLDQHPYLLATLERHISTNLDRQQTARSLHVHTNTVDYRLKRIARLTGLDPLQPSGLWNLRAALVARTYRAPKTNYPSENADQQ
ncbi:PucR family transcriptional regulator [Nocardia sp. NPDC050406]|uniref:PucR family transcriptional regulator n=1 Tax=Nocardia sp. NPDC050406 TaxID=3364318 RepID=UPI0037B97DB9